MDQANIPIIEQQVRASLNQSVGKRPYNMWFAGTTFHCGDNEVRIQAATPLAAGWIRDRFSGQLTNALREAYGVEDIRYTIGVKEQDCKIETAQPVLIPAQQSQRPVIKRVRQLLGFDEFVVGQCNALACAAAKELSSSGGLSISPLFIHGACGVGKTHLLQAICKHAAQVEGSKVRYITAEQFTNEFIASSRCGDFARFRNRYRTLDLLAIDDVHFVASKKKTQEELLHTLDAAGLRGARLVLASDEDPRQIKQLNRALANRFVAGMIAEISRPDRETRKQIIAKLSLVKGIALTEGAIDHLASQAVGSVREIEGVMTRLKAVSGLLMKSESCLGIDSVQQVMKSSNTVHTQVSMNDVIDVVCKRAAITSHELRGRSRASTVVFWRSVSAYLGRSMTNMSYPELAQALGRKNHSTVHAAVKRITEELQSDSPKQKYGPEHIEIQELIDQLTWAIRNHAQSSSTKSRARKEPARNT